MPAADELYSSNIPPSKYFVNLCYNIFSSCYKPMGTALNRCSHCVVVGCSPLLIRYVIVFADVSSYCVAEKAFLGCKILAGVGMCSPRIETVALKIHDIVTVCVNFHSLPEKQNDLILMKTTAGGSSTGLLNILVIIQPPGIICMDMQIFGLLRIIFTCMSIVQFRDDTDIDTFLGHELSLILRIAVYFETNTDTIILC